MSSETFTILAARAGDAREKLKKFSKKAKRYKVPFAWSIGEPYVVEMKAEAVDWLDETYLELKGKRTRKVSFVDVTLEGETPKVGNYEFLASIEMTAAGNFIDTVPGESVPAEYREAKNFCDHCKVHRRRTHVFVVRELETGAYKVVGRTCLRDFLGTDDPRMVLEWMKFYRAVKDEEGESGWYSMGRLPWAEELRFLLAVTSTLIRMYGWCSKGAAYNDYTDSLTATATHLWDIYAKEGKAKAHGDEIMAELKESDLELADKVIDWVRNVVEPENDYLHNLKVAFADDVLGDPKRVGLAISGVSAYHRAMEKELRLMERAKWNASASYVGDVGERLKGLKVKLESSKYLGAGTWGDRSLLKFRTDGGDLLTWFTGSDPRLDIGEELTIDATVKKHNEFRGSKETVVTRVSVK